MDSLFAVVSAYRAATNLSEARVATLIANDGKFLKQLHAGSSCTVRKYEDAMAWFSERWPEMAIWPEGVPRPAPTKQIEAAE